MSKLVACNWSATEACPLHGKEHLEDDDLKESVRRKSEERLLARIAELETQLRQQECCVDAITIGPWCCRSCGALGDWCKSLPNGEACCRHCDHKGWEPKITCARHDANTRTTSKSESDTRPCTFPVDGGICGLVAGDPSAHTGAEDLGSCRHVFEHDPVEARILEEERDDK